MAVVRTGVHLTGGGLVTALMPIGDFARLTHLSIKALRHYHDVGLLEPASIDPTTGYRSYSTAQVPVALAIRRFRDLEMPIEQVRAVLEAPDPTSRNDALLSHLLRMESQLEQTQEAILALRMLLEDEPAHPSIELRTVGTTAAIAVTDTVDWEDTEAWLGEARAELHAALSSPARAGADGALYPDEFFEAHRGEVIAFTPFRGALPATTRVEQIEVPSAHLAVIVHEGPIDTLDQTYGELGTFVIERGLGNRGPIREYYLVTEADTPDTSKLRTEVCWPTVAPREHHSRR
jgi:DNA-binding transcriptional MerR regulator